MLSWLFEIWIWNLNHKQFKILANFWRWNHTKIMHQIIVIKFSNIFSNYCLCWHQDVHFFHLIYHFFSILYFAWFFFSCFSNKSICINTEFHNFYSTYFNLRSKISQHRIENRVILILELKTVWRNFKNTIELMYRICIDLTHKYELKSKRKKHQRIKKIQIKNWTKKKSD